MYKRIVPAIVIGLLGIAGEAKATKYYTSTECSAINDGTASFGVEVLKGIQFMQCLECLKGKDSYFELVWAPAFQPGKPPITTRKCFSPATWSKWVNSYQTILRMSDGPPMCQKTCDLVGMQWVKNKFTLNSTKEMPSQCQCQTFLGPPPPKREPSPEEQLQAMRQGQELKEANRYTVENQEGNSPLWTSAGSWILGGRLKQHIVALQFSSKDGKLTGTVTYNGEKPGGFRATPGKGINEYAVETESGGNWQSAGTWQLGSHREPLVALDAKSTDQGTSLIGSMTYQGGRPTSVRMWLASSPRPAFPETAAPTPPTSGTPVAQAPIKPPTVSPAPTMASPNRYTVENVWGPDGWHPGGTWIIGGRDKQRVVELQISAKDDGKTLTGTVTYDGEKPVGFRATAKGNNQYAVEIEAGGNWQPGGTWVIGGRVDQSVVDLTAKSADQGKMLTGNMTYSGNRGVGSDKIGFKAVLEGSTPAAPTASASPTSTGGATAPSNPDTVMGLQPGQGRKATLQADDGSYFARCTGCQKTVDNRFPDTVTTNGTSSAETQFELINVGHGKIALKADTGKFVTRCNGCIIGGAKPDFATVHATSSADATAQFTPVLLPNGKYGLKADTGKFLARCNGCSPGASKPNTVTIHAADPNSESNAQWKIVFQQ